MVFKILIRHSSALLDCVVEQRRESDENCARIMRAIKSATTDKRFQTWSKIKEFMSNQGWRKSKSGATVSNPTRINRLYTRLAPTLNEIKLRIAERELRKAAMFRYPDLSEDLDAALFAPSWLELRKEPVKASGEMRNRRTLAAERVYDIFFESEEDMTDSDVESNHSTTLPSVEESEESNFLSAQTQSPQPFSPDVSYSSVSTPISDRSRNRKLNDSVTKTPTRQQYKPQLSSPLRQASANVASRDHTRPSQCDSQPAQTSQHSSQETTVSPSGPEIRRFVEIIPDAEPAGGDASGEEQPEEDELVREGQSKKPAERTTKVDERECATRICARSIARYEPAGHVEEERTVRSAKGMTVPVALCPGATASARETPLLLREENMKQLNKLEKPMAPKRIPHRNPPPPSRHWTPPNKLQGLPEMDAGRFYGDPSTAAQDPSKYLASVQPHIPSLQASLEHISALSPSGCSFASTTSEDTYLPTLEEAFRPKTIMPRAHSKSIKEAAINLASFQDSAMAKKQILHNTRARKANAKATQSLLSTENPPSPDLGCDPVAQEWWSDNSSAGPENMERSATKHGKKRAIEHCEAGADEECDSIIESCRSGDDHARKRRRHRDVKCQKDIVTGNQNMATKDGLIGDERSEGKRKQRKRRPGKGATWEGNSSEHAKAGVHEAPTLPDVLSAKGIPFDVDDDPFATPIKAGATHPEPLFAEESSSSIPPRNRGAGGERERSESWRPEKHKSRKVTADHHGKHWTAQPKGRAQTVGPIDLAKQYRHCCAQKCPGEICYNRQ
ncbi:hypothetical protein GGR57DRAFT_282782 [Xylariaceae sp. FL1272]|nr:hypothetical protein GGR57DRAFT_282782 [Xylariaceae sp. FL1272]